MDANLTIVLLVVFLATSAFFSCSETAFFTLQSVRVHHLVTSKAKNAERLAKLKEQPERFLATMLLGNNLCNTAITALATTLAIEIVGPSHEGLGVAMATGLVTIALVVLGETAPKTLGTRHPEEISLALARFWQVVDKVLFPVAVVLHGASRLVTFPFPSRKEKRPIISVDELRTMVRVGTSEGIVEESQAEMVHKAFRFGDLRAQEIMTPRTEIVRATKGTSLQDFLHTYAKATHTRYPVYDEAENVIGILHIQDVLLALGRNGLGMSNPMTLLTRPAHFYPETKPVDDLFVEMRNNGTQMVLLVNEYGGIAGLLTMKQVVGEVVGRITDEEKAAPEVRQVEGGAMDVDASIRVEAANERLDMKLCEGDYDTLAGYVLTALGHIPRVGEQVAADGVRLTVTEMQGLRIEKIRISKA